MNNTLPKSARYLFFFALVDIFFAPYFPLFAIATSQIFVFLWFILKGQKYCSQNEVKAFWWFFLLMVLSNFVSLFVIPSGEFDKFFVDNWKRGINVGVSITYYFLFTYSLKRMDITVWKWVFALVVYMFLWAVLYYINMGEFFHYKLLFNPRDSTMLGADPDVAFRYNFIWTDPNNVGYAIIALVTTLSLIQSTPNLIVAVSILLSSFVAFMTMSMGTLISELVFVPLALLFRMKNGRSVTSVISLFAIVFLVGFVAMSLSGKIMKSDIGERSFTRIETKQGTGDDRPTIWRTVIEKKSFITHAVLGEGSNIFVDDRPYSPHSGHLMLIFSYGMIAYILYMYIFFRKPHRQSLSAYIPTLPFLFCFTSNIGIGEIKFVGVMAFVVAAMRIHGSLTHTSPLKKYKYNEGKKNIYCIPRSFGPRYGRIPKCGSKKKW